jgi:D-beta-D-heptose 7-phosphate kinase/D-beta-D-heptose 1-phosphate adenosyltransferase
MGRVVTQEELIVAVAERKRNGERVVFTNGCFDLLHPGHVRLLEWARGQGDVLVVGLNSNVSVTAIKGPGRPVIPEAERAEVLAALECVDYVALFDEPTPQKIIARVLPDVLVKGPPWREEEVVGRQEVLAAGGRVELFPAVEGLAYSTTEIINRMQSLHKTG